MNRELFVRGLYTRIAVARHPCFSWALLLLTREERDSRITGCAVAQALC